MKTFPMILAVALLSGVTATAQTKTPAMDKSSEPMKSSPEHTCLMETDAAAWKAVGLNADQMSKVQVIQATCKKECDAAKNSASDEKAQMDHKATMERHTAELKKAITPEQYDKWVAWCSDRTKRSELKD